MYCFTLPLFGEVEMSKVSSVDAATVEFSISKCPRHSKGGRSFLGFFITLQ